MIATSGLVSRIHSCDFTKPENTRFQYGSSVLPLSSAAPMAGTCDEPTPAMILATGYFRFADLDFDFALAFDLVLDLAAALTFGFATLFFAGAAPDRNFDGVLLPVLERLPSTLRPPLIIMSA